MIRSPKIESIELIEKKDTEIKVRITFDYEESDINCCGGLGLDYIRLEYALHDVYYNLLQDFRLIPDLPKTLKKTDIYTIPIPPRCSVVSMSGGGLNGGWIILDPVMKEFPHILDDTIIGVPNKYSDLLKAGDYPDAALAIPNSLKATFDSIAIPPDMRVIFYSGKNFTGQILLDQVGPALIWNILWTGLLWPNTDQYIKYFDDDFTDPVLQSIYPQSRRFWSTTLMHHPDSPGGTHPMEYWGAQGSFKIIGSDTECLDDEPCQIAFRLVCDDYGSQ